MVPLPIDGKESLVLHEIKIIYICENAEVLKLTIEKRNFS